MRQCWEYHTTVRAKDGLTRRRYDVRGRPSSGSVSDGATERVSHATEDVAALEDGPAYEIVSVLHDGTANA